MQPEMSYDRLRQTLEEGKTIRTSTYSVLVCEVFGGQWRFEKMHHVLGFEIFFFRLYSS